MIEYRPARFVWVDPPSGSLRGFPKIWDKEEFPELGDFLSSFGIDPNVIDGVWCTEATKDDIEEYLHFKHKGKKK